MSVDGFEAMMDAAGDPAFLDFGSQDADPATLAPGVGDDVYRACFGTTAGRAVLRDLYQRFVNGTRFVPGEPADAGFFRDGRAAVVFDIAGRIEAASQGETE